MNAPAKIEAAQIIPFNAYAAYEAEREANRKLWEHLTNAINMLEAATGELERLGEDQDVRKAYIRRLRRERFV